MSRENCSICQRPKAYAHCGICQCALCKSCEHFQEPDRFPFLEVVPEELTLVHYCPDCFETTVVPAEESYAEMMATARKINIFFTSEKNLPRLLKKANKSIAVKNCKDRDETILRLGFKAAELGFNSVVKVELGATQIRNITHQKNAWHGVGIPADIDEAKYFR